MVIAIAFLSFMLLGIMENAIENAAFAKKLENLKNDPNVIHYKGRELVSVDLKNPNRFKV
jgi:hypothetical protein